MDLTLQPYIIDGEDFSKELFDKEYKSSKIPLIIKNYSRQFPAGKKWTFDYFKQKLGDQKVGIFDNNIKRNTAFTEADLHMPFADFLDIIQKDEETNYRMFAFDIFKECPELRKDFPTPDIMKGILGKLVLSFFGGKNTTVRFHYDIDGSNVLMTQVLGKKRVILISPDYNNLVYKVPYTSFSLIDLKNPDYEKYPGLKFVKGYDFILEPGDALFMPSRYWHFNTYLEGGMAISFRSLSHSPKDILTGVLNTTTRILFDKTMNGILNDKWYEIKTNRAKKMVETEIEKITN